ncbi:MAG: hypothetical protein HOP10_12990 [Chitinophagaceae bacterium]|nr:hypothetical protein [Chitinophagaceae bacterium]
MNEENKNNEKPSSAYDVAKNATQLDNGALSFDLSNLKDEEEGEYFIALFDVLGFSDLQKEIGLTKMHSQYKDLINDVVLKDLDKNPLAMTLVNINFRPALVAGRIDIKYAYFSDTIILWARQVKFLFPLFIDRCSEFLVKAIEIGLPLRGAISIGRAVMDKQSGIFIGEPIVEAARLESAQDWIGITFGNSIHSLPVDNNSFKFTEILFNYEKHMKPEKKALNSMISVDWARKAREQNKTETIVSILTSRMEKFKDKAHYYSNTLDFMNYSLTNHDWAKKIVDSYKEKQKDETQKPN